MKNKIIGSIGFLVVMLLLTIPSISFGLAESSDITKDTIDEVFESGWIILVSSNLQGIDEGLHVGGMSNINVTATYQNTLLLRTKPIWGSTIITEDVDIQIQMKHFFGIVDIVGNAGEIVGICEDVSWKLI